MNGEPVELAESGSSMVTFSSIMGTKAVMFTLYCSTKSDHFMKAWERIRDRRYREFHSVTCTDHRWGILFILLPLCGKLPKVAESSGLHLPSSKQKCTYMCTLDC